MKPEEECTEIENTVIATALNKAIEEYCRFLKSPFNPTEKVIYAIALGLFLKALDEGLWQPILSEEGNPTYPEGVDLLWRFKDGRMTVLPAPLTGRLSVTHWRPLP